MTDETAFMSLDALKMKLETFWDQIEDWQENPPSNMFEAGQIIGTYSYYIQRQHEYIRRLESLVEDP